MYFRLALDIIKSVMLIAVSGFLIFMTKQYRKADDRAKAAEKRIESGFIVNPSKVIVYGRTALDLTNDTITPEDLREGITAHNRRGEPIVGTAKFEEKEKKEKAEG